MAFPLATYTGELNVNTGQATGGAAFDQHALCGWCGIRPNRLVALGEGGVIVSHEAIRQWCPKFGAFFGKLLTASATNRAS